MNYRMSSSIDQLTKTSLWLFIGIPILLLAIVAILAALYNHRKRKERLLLLELPRRERASLGVDRRNISSQKKKGGNSETSSENSVVV